MFKPCSRNREKMLYDVKLSSGEIIPLCYPNANSWNAMYTLHDRIDDSDVTDISYTGYHCMDLYDEEDTIREHLESLGLSYDLRKEYLEGYEKSKGK